MSSASNNTPSSPRNNAPSSPRSSPLVEDTDELVLPCSKNNSRAASVARTAARALLLQGLYKEAVSQLEKACALERENAHNFELITNAMLLAGNTGEARGKLMRAKELAPYSAMPTCFSAVWP